jgi:hypothetical protein
MQKIKAPSIKDLRIFAFIVSLGFLVIGWGIPVFKKHPINLYLINFSTLIFILGMLFPKTLVKPREYWIVIGNALGKINSTIFFTLIYFFIFSTVGLMFKVFGRDRMHTHFKGIKTTMVLKKEISPFTEPF